MQPGFKNMCSYPFGHVFGYYLHFKHYEVEKTFSIFGWKFFLSSGQDLNYVYCALVIVTNSYYTCYVHMTSVLKAYLNCVLSILYQ